VVEAAAQPPSGERTPLPSGIWGLLQAQAGKPPKARPATASSAGMGENRGTGGATAALPPIAEATAGEVTGPKVPESTAGLPPMGPKNGKTAAPAGGANDVDPMTLHSLAKAGEAKSQADGKGDAASLPTLPPVPPLEEKKQTAPPVPALPDLPPDGDQPPAGGTAGSQRPRPTPAPPPAPLPADAGTTGSTGTGGTTTPKSPEKPATARIGGIDTGASADRSITVGGPSQPTPAPVVDANTGGAAAALMKAPAPIVVGGVPAASVPAMTVRASQGDVVSYTEVTHETGPGDSFKSISQAKYGSDKYAAALYQFNRSHPLAEDNLPDDGSLKPRQKVYVPPAEILEGRYPEQIKATAPVAGVPVSSGPRRASATTYRVATGGEFEYDIARKQLGDGNRWLEIQKLNPGWRPEIPIPAGTELALPAP
jgi:hypothetical protein